MNRSITLLSLLLMAQIALGALVFWPRQDVLETASNSALLAVDAATLDRIIISDSKDSLVLARGDNGWYLPEYHQLPVDLSKLNAARDTLPALTRGWPVAQTPDAQQRFEVANDNYQRQVAYFADGQAMGSLYLGTAPGFRKVHLRPSGEQAVYSVEFNSFDLPTQASDWMDQALLQLEDVSAIGGRDFSVQQKDGSWMDESGSIPSPEVLESLLNGLKSLRVAAVVDLATAGMLEQTVVEPNLTVTAGKGSYEYRLFDIDGAYYVARSDIPIYFSLSALDYDRLNEADATTLFPMLSEAESDSDEQTATTRSP